MKEIPKYNINTVNLREITHEETGDNLRRHAAESMDALAELITDPTTAAANITAVVRGVDDTITVKNIYIDHTANEGETSGVINDTTATWTHQIPESVLKVYDDMSASIGLIFANTTDQDSEDEDEEFTVTIGETSDEIILTLPHGGSDDDFSTPDDEGENDECC